MAWNYNGYIAQITSIETSVIHIRIKHSGYTDVGIAGPLGSPQLTVKEL